MKKRLSAILVLFLILCLGTMAADAASFPADRYMQGAVPDEIHRDSTTRAFPVSAKRAVHVENENARAVYFYFGDNPDPLICYIVPDGTAHLRLEIAETDDPYGIMLFDLPDSFLQVTDLLAPDQNAYVYDQAAEGVYQGTPIHYSCGILFDRGAGTKDPAGIGYFLTSDDQYIEDIAADLRSEGAADLRWEAGDLLQAENPLQAYILHVVDQNNDPVAETFVNFCTDTACVPKESDDEGLITFNGAPDIYHVQLIAVPEGYSFDEDFELHTARAYGEWILRVRKD